MLFARVVVLMRFLLAQSSVDAIAHPHVKNSSSERSAPDRKSEPSHNKFTQTILDTSPFVRVVGGCAPSLAVERQRWRQAVARRYGISGNRGVSKLTSSARAWPRTRSRRSAGVPSASGLRSISDQWLGPAPAVVVPARAHATYERNVNRRIFSQAF